VNKQFLLMPILLILVSVMAFGVNKLSQNTRSAETLPVDGPPQWELPKFLREASGLAVFNDKYLLSHNDEKGNIYRIALADISIEKIASIGSPTISGDFEGIAIAGKSTYLITSTGELFQIDDLAIEQLKQTVSAKVIDTGVSKICEIEGLAYLDGLLLFPCKTFLQQDENDRLLVFSYSLLSGETKEYLSIPLEQLGGIKKISPTAMDVNDDDYFIVSNNRLLVIDRKTQSIKALSLPKKLHFKTEGIAVLEDGSIILVDDKKEGRSRLTRYRDQTDLKDKTKLSDS
jgi:hypothetical protein